MFWSHVTLYETFCDENPNSPEEIWCDYPFYYFGSASVLETFVESRLYVSQETKEFLRST